MSTHKGKMDWHVTEAILAIAHRWPGYVRLAWALVRDQRIPPAARRWVVGGGLYNLSPIDPVPGIIPVLGQLDDYAMLLLGIRKTLRAAPEEVRQEHLNRTGITADEIGCAMARASNASAVRAVPASAVSMQPTAAGAPAVISIATPFRGIDVMILKHSVNATLANGGLRALPNGTSMKTWHVACQMQTPVCQQGMRVVTADLAAGATRTDAGGRAEARTLPAGRYYVFGVVQIANRPMIWNLPVDLKSGPNSILLDLHNLTPVE